MRGQQRESQREPGPLAERRPRPDGESQRRLLQPREGVEQTQHARIFKQVARAGEQRQKSERPAGEAPPAERGTGRRATAARSGSCEDNAAERRPWNSATGMPPVTAPE